METTLHLNSGELQGDMAKAHLTEDQTAEFLNLKKRTLQAWRVRGCGPKFRKLGRSVRYRLEDLETFVNENVHQSTSEDSYREKTNLFTA